MLAVTSCSLAESDWCLCWPCWLLFQPLCHTWAHITATCTRMSDSNKHLRSVTGLCFYAFLINISVLMSYHVPVVTSVNTTGSTDVNEACFFPFFEKNIFHIIKLYESSDSVMILKCTACCCSVFCFFFTLYFGFCLSAEASGGIN